MVRLSHAAHWIQYLISSRSQEPCLCFQFLLLISSEWGTKRSSSVLFLAFRSIVFSLKVRNLNSLDWIAEERLMIFVLPWYHSLLSYLVFHFVGSTWSDPLSGQQASMDRTHIAFVVVPHFIHHANQAKTQFMVPTCSLAGRGTWADTSSCTVPTSSSQKPRPKCL